MVLFPCDDLSRGHWSLVHVTVVMVSASVFPEVCGGSELVVEQVLYMGAVILVCIFSCDSCFLFTMLVSTLSVVLLVVSQLVWLLVFHTHIDPTCAAYGLSYLACSFCSLLLWRHGQCELGMSIIFDHSLPTLERLKHKLSGNF